MSQIKCNIFANLSGWIWTNILSILFIPLYVRFMGMESYGLVGFFVILLNGFALLDFGLSTTLKREMARLSVLKDKVEEQRDLLRTLEIVYWTISFFIAILVIIIAPIIANHWVNPQQLSVTTVENAVRLMGLVIALQLPFSFYKSGLMGLERQVLANGISVISGTLRTGGAVLVLWLISSSIETFFIWQLLTSGLQTLAVVHFLWRSLPESEMSSTFQKSLLYGVRGFAAAVSGNAILGAILSQMDKVILSKMLTLEMFGYYVLAASVATGLLSIIVPINSALFPRFTQLLELRDEVRLRDLYHRACQFMSAALLPIAITIAFFSKEIIIIWMHDTVVAENIHLILSLLIIGTMLDGLASVSGYLQFAAGWPQLYMYIHLVSVLIFIPMVVLMVNYYGAVGAAIVWVLLNSVYMIFSIPIMHRRLLKGEKWKYYREDVILPFIGVIVVVWISRKLMPVYTSMITTAVYLFGTWILALMASVLLAPQIRKWTFAVLTYCKKNAWHKARTHFEDGLRKTIEWYSVNHG